MPIFKQHFDCILRGSKSIYVIAVIRSSCEVVFVIYLHSDYSYNLMGNYVLGGQIQVMKKEMLSTLSP